jgi:hypothetical protein
VTEERKTTNTYFQQLGLNTNDPIQMNFIRGLLTTIITEHFRCRYTWEQIVQGPSKSRLKKTHAAHGTEIKYDDLFYEQFAELLAKFYLHGVSSISYQPQVIKIR